MDLNGIWYNELNSTMFLHVQGKRLSGFYISAVGDASGPYELIGFLDATDPTPTLGWTVVWQNAAKVAHSVTTWCGQAQEVNNEQRIDTTWLLTQSTAVKEDWEATMTSKDLFQRLAFTPAQLAVTKEVRGVKKLREVSEREVREAIEGFKA